MLLFTAICGFVELAQPSAPLQPMEFAALAVTGREGAEPPTTMPATSAMDPDATTVCTSVEFRGTPHEAMLIVMVFGTEAYAG